MNYDSQWYKGRKPHEKVFAYLRSMDNRQSYRQEDNIRNMKLYGNNDYVGISAYNYYRSESTSTTLQRVTLNVIQSMIDTVVSKVTKNKPKPYFLTDGGDFSMQRRGEKLTQFIEGVFYSTDFYKKTEMAFKDACI